MNHDALKLWIDLKEAELGLMTANLQLRCSIDEKNESLAAKWGAEIRRAAAAVRAVHEEIYTFFGRVLHGGESFDCALGVQLPLEIRITNEGDRMRFNEAAAAVERSTELGIVCRYLLGQSELSVTARPIPTEGRGQLADAYSQFQASRQVTLDLLAPLRRHFSA